MITTANYIMHVHADNGETYVFSYDTPDVWSALEELWREDWDDYLSGILMNSAWPIDAYAMDDGKVVRTYRFRFCTSAFHAFFDKGHVYSGPYTLEQFAKDIELKDPFPENLLREFIRKNADIRKVSEVTCFVDRFLDRKKTLDSVRNNNEIKRFPGYKGLLAFHQKEYDTAMLAMERSLIYNGVESIGVSDFTK